MGRAFFVTSRNGPGFLGMKTFITLKTLSVLASVLASVFLAALVALVLSSASFEFITSALFAAGFVAIVLSDYGRAARPVAADTAVPARPAERLGLAA